MQLKCTNCGISNALGEGLLLAYRFIAVIENSFRQVINVHAFNLPITAIAPAIGGLDSGELTCLGMPIEPQDRWVLLRC